MSVTKQAELVGISRSTVYYLPRAVPAADLALMRRIDELHLEFPFAGSRMLRRLLAADGSKIGRRHVKTLMSRMGLEALYRRPRTDALARHGKPDIFNTDQGSRFTGAAFTGALIFVERLWRTIKYEEVYLRAYDSVSDARQSIGRYLDLYNRRRPHSSLDGQTPDRAYYDHDGKPPIRLAA